MRNSNSRPAAVAMAVVAVTRAGTTSAVPLPSCFASGQVPANAASLRP